MMKEILLTLSILLLVLSCKTQGRKQSGKLQVPQKTVSIKVKPQQFIGKLPDKLDECSGIIFFDNLFWTFNDSGGDNILFAINRRGKIEKKIEIKDARNVDWEDIAQDKKYIYIGDVGNNNGVRNNQQIYKIKKRNIGKKKKQSVNASRIKIEYQDQKSFDFQPKNTPFDCEAIIEWKGWLYLFTKDWKTLTTTVYKVSRKAGNYKMLPVEKFNVSTLITGADVSPDKTQLALVGYKNYKPVLWLFSTIQPGNFFEGAKKHIEMDEIFDAQTEGICFLGNDTLLISCEKTKTFNQQVFMIDLKNIN
ncbi:MAG: hypothetical protein J7L95_05320 [Prolixibacteraceae bacterium]|nr:hypothetical protein [Prolixibacteraceae bacterium]